jgi:CheY-like chemotaxis protein
MRVLAVDDDTMVLELLQESLTLFGHSETMTAISADAALGILRGGQTRIDCFLLDIQMPGMDGIELCKKIREMRIYARTPIIMLTAMSQPEYVERAFAAGATDYLTKPFEFLELAFRLRMAERLASEIRKVSDGQGEIARMRRVMGAPASVSIDHPVEIVGVEGAIGYTSFENYIMQLSRSSQFASSVFAVEIADIQKLHASASASEYLYLLNSVAKAIASTMSEVGSLLAYRGNGVFVCVSHHRAGTSADDVRSDIDQFLRVSQDRECRGRRINVTVSERVSIGAISKFGALQSIHRAMASLGKAGNAKSEAFGRDAGIERARVNPSAAEILDPDDIEEMLRETLARDISPTHQDAPAQK